MTVSKTRKGFINSMHKYVYLFSEGNGSMRELLGGKGANLAEMTNLGMPVPQGFTISTEACTKYYEDDRNINDEIKAQVYEALARIEKINGKKFGDAKNPLLVSVPRLHARHDGHHPEPRPERRGRRRSHRR